MGVDTHIILVPSPSGPIPTPTPLPFVGELDDALSSSVFIDDQPAALVGSVARHVTGHVPIGGTFQKQPANRGVVSENGATIFIDDRRVARVGDAVKCCSDANDGNGSIDGTGTVITDP